MENATTKIEIEGGYVLVRNKVTRKAMRLYRGELFKDAETEKVLNEETGLVEERNKLKSTSMDDAYNVLVLNMVTLAMIDEKEVVVDQEFIDCLETLDFDKILTFADALVADAMKKKKELKN